MSNMCYIKKNKYFLKFAKSQRVAPAFTTYLHVPLHDAMLPHQIHPHVPSTCGNIASPLTYTQLASKSKFYTRRQKNVTLH